jgi:hypothetical protein
MAVETATRIPGDHLKTALWIALAAAISASVISRTTNEETASCISFKPFSHADDVVGFESDSPVELDHLGVAGADLDIDLRAAHLPQSVFGFRHHFPANPLPPEPGRNRQIVEPAPVAVIPRHDGGNQLPRGHTDQEQLGLNPELASDIPQGIVPGNDQVAVFPQLNDGRVITRLKGSDLSLHRCDIVPFDSRLDPRDLPSIRPAGSAPFPLLCQYFFDTPDLAAFQAHFNPVGVSRGFRQNVFHDPPGESSGALVLLQHDQDRLSWFDIFADSAVHTFKSPILNPARRRNN